MRPIFVFCEGSQDIAFLCRLIQETSAATPYTIPLKEYPKPLNYFFGLRFSERIIEHAKFRPSGPMVPDNLPVLQAAYKLPDPDRLLLFLNCYGADRTEEVSKFLTLLVGLGKSPETTKGLPAFGLVFVNDADELGINQRLANLKTTYTPILHTILPRFSLMSANDVLNDGPFSAGCCIFAEPGKNTGTLENILAPLMRVRQQSRQDVAQQFVLDHIPGTKIEVTTPASRRIKAVLTVAGQHNLYGDSLVVIVRDSDALHREDMAKSLHCCTYAKVLTRI
jgi:hypothetical protein